MMGFAFGTLFVFAILGLAFLVLYLPSLVIARLLFHVRRRKGRITRFLSRPIGPSIPGQGADPSALRHALRRWAVLGLKTVSLAIGSGAVAPWYALFGGPTEDGLVISFVIVTCAALFASLVSGVECLFLLVRLVLHGLRNPTDSLALGDKSDPSHDRVIPPSGPRPPLSCARLAAQRARAV
jgi:hypothetical protein